MDSTPTHAIGAIPNAPANAALENERRQAQEWKRKAEEAQRQLQANQQVLVDQAQRAATRERTAQQSLTQALDALSQGDSVSACAMRVFDALKKSGALGDAYGSHAERVLGSRARILDIAAPAPAGLAGSDPLQSMQDASSRAGRAEGLAEWAGKLQASPLHPEKTALLEFVGDALTALDPNGDSAPSRGDLAALWSDLLALSAGAGFELLYPAPGSAQDSSVHDMDSLARGTGLPDGTVASVRAFGYRTTSGKIGRKALVEVASS